jgi:hypothetical protein
MEMILKMMIVKMSVSNSFLLYWLIFYECILFYTGSIKINEFIQKFSIGPLFYLEKCKEGIGGNI